MPEESSIVHAEHAVALVPTPAPPIEAIPSPDGDGILFLARDGYELHEVAGPKVNVRHHTFEDVRSFAQYLVRHASDRKRTEILVSEKSITAALDPASPTGDVVTCALVHDVRFDAWTNHMKGPIDQKTMLNLVRAQKGDLDVRIADMLLAAMQSFKLTRGGEMQNDLAPTGFTRFHANIDKRDVVVEVPDSWYISIPVFEGIEVANLVPTRAPIAPGEEVPATLVVQPASYTIDVYLSIDVTERGPLFTLMAPGLPAIVRQARQDAAAFLRRELGEGFLVGLGKYSTTEVPACTGPREVPA